MLKMGADSPVLKCLLGFGKTVCLQDSQNNGILSEENVVGFSWM